LILWKVPIKQDSIHVLLRRGANWFFKTKVDPKPTSNSSFAEAARWAFDNLSLELQRSAEDDNFTEELEEFLNIMDNSDVDEEDFYKYLEFEHEDQDCAISLSARNYPTHATRVTFDDDDGIIEPANYLTEVEFSDSDQEPTLQWQPEYGFPLRSSATYHPKIS